MTKKSRFGLKAKIVVGLLVTFGISAVATSYCVVNFLRLEDLLNRTNSKILPLTKTLAQLEDHQYLFEQDLNRTIRDGGTQIGNFHSQIMEAKINTLWRSFGDENNNPDSSYAKELGELKASFNLFMESLHDYSQAPDIEQAKLKELSHRRAQYKRQIQGFILKLENENVRISDRIQYLVNRSIFFVLVLSLMLIFAICFLIVWIGRILSPLKQLTTAVKQISETGLYDSDVDTLHKIAKTPDEIGIFSLEFSRMASSLLDRNKEILRQSDRLERAHEEMERKNIDLKQTKDKLHHQEKLALIGKLSAQMAHEIRNPLNALSLHLESLEDDCSLSNLESIDHMKNEIDRLSAITENYLDYARSSKLSLENTNLNEMLEKVRRFYKPLLDEKGIEFKMDLDELPKLEIDGRQFHLVLSNLIRNSSEAIIEKEGDQGGKWIQVKSRVNPNNQKVELEFSDSGEGIDSVCAESIFTPFFTTKASGTGLGLAHSKQVVEAHGGRIEYHRNNFQGATFRISLPMKDN